jgi:hypothetical protein
VRHIPLSLRDEANYQERFVSSLPKFACGMNRTYSPTTHIQTAIGRIFFVAELFYGYSSTLTS